MNGLTVKGIDFGPVFVASGGNNFNGEGWLYDKLFRWIPGYNFKGVTHYTKTFTIDNRNDSKNGKGNMDIDPVTLQPKEVRPKCIKINFIKPFVLNSVGLSNLGFETHLKRGDLQKLKHNFLISIMSIGKTIDEQLAESEQITRLLEMYLPEFKAKVGIVRNISCPNAGHKTNKLIDYTKRNLKTTARLNIPQGIKINLLTSVQSVREIVEDGCCDFIDIPNSYPIIDMPNMSEIRNCRQAKYILGNYNNTGGYSGPLQTPVVRDWIMQARDEGIEVPIIAGSVYCKKHIKWMHDAGANAIALGSVKLLRPWRFGGMKKYAHKLFGTRGAK